ncbi:MAG: hypothetical protein ACXW0H_10310 [Methylobacter sp.]
MNLLLDILFDVVFYATKIVLAVLLIVGGFLYYLIVWITIMINRFLRGAYV